MKRRWLGWIVAMAGFAVGAGGQNLGNEVAEFQRAHPDAGLYYTPDGRLSRVWGTAFAIGATPEESAASFIRDHGAMLAQGVGQLLPMPGEPGGPVVQELMWDRQANAPKFHLIRYDQFANSIPVFRGSTILLMRNLPGHPVVLASVNVRDLQGLELADGAGQGDATLSTRALRQIRRAMGGEAAIVGGPRFVIWAGYEDLFANPRLAIESIAEIGTVADPDTYGKKLFITDAGTGAILFVEDQVHHVDIGGNVSGVATDEIGADICSDESAVGLPYAQARVVGGNLVFANAAGNFTIPHGGNTQVTVESALRGQWFEVFDSSLGGATPILSQQVVPPGPANFLHNSGNASEFARSNVNCYLHANIVRDFVLSYDPTYPTIGTQQFFDINTNLSSTCNAFYNGGSINFFRAGGGCPNTGFDTVVYHEYGHHLVQVAGSGQGAYGEGMSDCVAVLVTDDPILARGFTGNCNSGIRNANNNCQYQTSGCSSCGGEIHACGQLISGCVWSLRNELLNSEPGTYRDTLAELTIASIRLHQGSSIDPSITIDFITVDDDDGNAANGSPHYDEINTAFTAHNMPAPPLSLIGFDYPNGRPSSVDPAGGTVIRVEVFGIAEDPQAGTGMLHVDTGSGFTAIPMQEVADNVYDGVFPPSICSSEVRYYLSAETTDGDIVTDPPNAPAGAFTAISAGSFGLVFQDTFETNQGWTVVNENLTDGAWSRGVPVNGNRGDPPTDSDDAGAQCFVTDNVPGNSDVDGGPTRLLSPIIDMSTGDDFFVSYRRWFTNDDGDGDRLDVHISNNGGSTWVLVESVPGDGTNSGQWRARTFDVSDFLTPTSTMRLRFSATDNPNDSVTEAGIDSVEVFGIACSETTLTGVEVTFGSLIAGGLPEIVTSDNVRLRARSSFGFSVQEPVLVVLNVDALTSVSSPATLDVTVEGRINQSGGSARWNLRDWSSNEFVQVHNYPIGMTEAAETLTGIAAGNFVRNDGVIELEIRKAVLASFSVTGFDSLTDQVAINVD